MSDYIGRRRRRQNLLIVEGDHEKNKLFNLIFRCFPEINIDIDAVWIYGTNIYMLYDDIIKEYGERWVEDEIDLPFVISKRQSLGDVRYKEDFVNIILVFDYERHDPNFSEQKILEMQDYFDDAADTGRLYINYPMIESYQHLRALPDGDYAERKIPVSLQPGRKYKELVRDETGIAHLIDFPHKVKELLSERYGIGDSQVCGDCYESILNISDVKNIEVCIQEILKNAIEDRRLQTAIFQFSELLRRLGYVFRGETYWSYMRDAFRQIIIHNICKAQRIQNQSSQDAQNGFIWVLNTSVFFVAEYNFSLLAV